MMRTLNIDSVTNSQIHYKAVFTVVVMLYCKSLLLSILKLKVCTFSPFPQPLFWLPQSGIFF